MEDDGKTEERLSVLFVFFPLRYNCMLIVLSYRTTLHKQAITVSSFH